MEHELTDKLNTLLGSIKTSLNDIKRDPRKGRGLKKAVDDSRRIATEVLEQQLGGVSLEDEIKISELSDEDWLITAKHIIDLLNEPFVPVNRYDTYFMQLFDYLRKTDEETLLSNFAFSYNKLMQEEWDKLTEFEEFFKRFPFWGEMASEPEDTGVYVQRINTLKHHAYDLLWIFKRLGDYTSKRTFSAVLMNWADLQINGLMAVRSIYKDYCEPDIFPDNKNDVFVDAGSGNGETIEDYATVYGDGYSKIYAYDLTAEAIDKTRQRIEALKLENVELRQKAAADVKSKRFVVLNEDEPLYNLTAKSEGAEKIDAVKLDDDIKDVPTFIKIDVSGAEKEVLSGCSRTIRKHHPKLAVAVYYNVDDIWQIPSMISEMYDGYKFYLRFYGNEHQATNVVLFCKPEVNGDDNG